MYRDGGPPRCHICEDADAAGACTVCRRDTCARHLASDHAGWCRKCDDAYYVYIRKTDGMKPYLAWWLGVVPLVIVTVAVASWVFVPTMIYTIAGFPVARWRSKVGRTKRFIAATRRAGIPLAPAPEHDDHARALAELDRKRDALITDRAHEHPGGDAAKPDSTS